TPARRLRDAIEPIAMVHVHSEEAREQYEAIGLDRFSGYVLGRAGTLGLAPTPLVLATFGVFEPETLAGVYASGLTTASVPDVLAGFRGDAHPRALVARGSGALESNLLTEALVGIDLRSYTRTRRWPEADIDAAVADLVDRALLTTEGTLTTRGAALRHDIED